MFYAALVSYVNVQKQVLANKTSETFQTQNSWSRLVKHAFHICYPPDYYRMNCNNNNKKKKNKSLFLLKPASTL